jgi:hypothetical protein
MRKRLLNLHVYGGLLCSSYLLIFGFSALHFNHHFRFAQAPPDDAKADAVWQQPMSSPPETDNKTAAEKLSGDLGLMGWPLPWLTRRDADGSIHFNLERPAKRYVVHALTGPGEIRVEETRKRFGATLVSLHAIGEMPGSRFMSWWGYYTELCTGVALFAAASGVYLWANSGRERRAGVITLGVAVAGSAGFMLYVIIFG